MNIINETCINPGDRVLIRSSLNAALDVNGEVVDPLRLRRMIDTIDMVISSGGIPILLSHISNDHRSTMEPVVRWFKNFAYNTILIKDYFPYNESLDNFIPHTVYVFENLRDYSGEKLADSKFAADLAKYGDLYVNESFDSAHRAHASTVILPKLLPAYAGVNFAREVNELSRVLDPDRPFSFIIGGAKIETKLPLIEKLLDTADKVFVAGAIMNPLLAAQGVEVGKSLMPEQPLDYSNIINRPNLELPVDFINQDQEVVSIDDTTPETSLLDIGPESIKAIDLLIEESDLVVWNGPLGNFEAGFATATTEIAAKLSTANCYSIIGGGDTLAAVDDKVQQGINWISTGGGAMLDFIESDGNLPAIKVLQL